MNSESVTKWTDSNRPELFARQLHRRKRLMEQLREYVEKGGKLLLRKPENNIFL